MSKFTTSIKKIQTIWERVEQNNSEIQNKDNSNQFEFFNNLLKQQNIKTPIELFNSGDINVIPNTDFISDSPFTAFKSEKMPTKASYSQIIDLQIPEIFLPFIKYSVEIKSLPDTDIHGFVLYDRSDFVDDSVEIRGDGTLIFKTDRLPTSGTVGGIGIDKVFSDSFFTSNGISFDLSKEVFKGTITKNDDSIVTGNVTSITTTVITAVGAGNCLGSDSTEIFQTNPLTNPDHEIISITSTSFTAIGDFIVTTFTDTGSSCDQNLVTTENVTKTFTFSAVDSYSIQLDGGVGIPSSNIKTKVFEANGRWLFWSTLKQKLFILNISIVDDGDFKEIAPTNFPDEDDGDTLPYTNITLKRNVVNIPDEIEKESVTLGFERVVTSEREFKNYVQISDSSAFIPTFRFQLNGSFIILSPAIVDNPNTTDFPVYNDIYTVGDTSYSLTTENHSILSKITFLPETQDITINIKAYLVNPLYWREQRKYNKNDF